MAWQPVQLGAGIPSFAETHVRKSPRKRRSGKRPVVEVYDRSDHYPTGDRLKRLRAFCQTARFGSISQAAAQLGWSQPSMSKQIIAREEDLGLSLFKRRKPRSDLTRAGTGLCRLAMSLVQGLGRLPDTFVEQHYGTAQGVPCIGAGQTSAAYLLAAGNFLLPRHVRRYRNRYVRMPPNGPAGGARAGGGVARALQRERATLLRPRAR